MPCPECGCQVGEFRFANSVETPGLDCGPYEAFYEEFVICCGCAAVPTQVQQSKITIHAICTLDPNSSGA
jgi:hypothetical protein